MNIFRFWWTAWQLSLGAPNGDTQPTFAREEMVLSLGASGNPRVLEVLISVLGNDVSPRVRRAAAQALGDLGDQRAIEPLLQVIARERERSMVLLAEIEDPVIAQNLGMRWSDLGWSQTIRHATYAALEKLKWRPGDPESDAQLALDHLLCSEKKDSVDSILPRLRTQQITSSLVNAICGPPLLTSLSFDDVWRVSQKQMLIDVLSENREFGAVARVLSYLLDLETAVGRHAPAHLDRGFKQLIIACVKGLGNAADPQWIPILRRTLEPVYFLDDERARTVANSLQAAGWKPADLTLQAHLLVATGRWDELLRMGPAGARVLAQIRFDHDCRDSKGKGIGCTGSADETLLKFGAAAVSPLIAAVDELADPDYGNSAAGPIIDLLYRLGDPRAVPAMKKASKLWRGESLTRGSVDRKIGELEVKAKRQSP